MNRIFTRFTLASAILVLLSPQLNAADKKGSKDHPMFSRFPGSEITDYRETEFDEFMIATGPMGAITAKTDLPPVQKIEGGGISISYLLKDKNKSFAQLYRNYRKAIQDVDAEIIFACKEEAECGKKFQRHLYWYGDPKRQGKHVYMDAPNSSSESVQYAYWSGKITVEKSTRFFSILVSTHNAIGRSVIILDVYTPDQVKLGLVSIDLDGLQSDIEKKGRVILDGLFFDHNKATLTAKSTPTVATIAAFLKADPKRSFYVVGHTDSRGAYDYNFKLSLARARTVVEILVKGHNVPRAKIQAVGVGPVSPTGTNLTEQGRAQNRRVELVLKD